MQTLDFSVAAAQLADRHAAAATFRAARRARTSSPGPLARLVLRRAAAKDEAALMRLARLDGASRPRGEMLVAEVEDEIVAAVPFDGGRAIADPFRPTADVVELLRARVELMAPRRAPRRGWHLRLPRPRLA